MKERKGATELTRSPYSSSPPFRLPVAIQVKTKLQAINFLDDTQRGKVLTDKEINGFAPNFIHSLDASHLFMTARACHVCSRPLSHTLLSLLLWFRS